MFTCAVVKTMLYRVVVGSFLCDTFVYVLSPQHTVTTLRDCPREDWLATHEYWLATGISTSFWRLVKTEHVLSSVPTSCRLKVAQSLHSVRLALDLPLKLFVVSLVKT